MRESDCVEGLRQKGNQYLQKPARPKSSSLRIASAALFLTGGVYLLASQFPRRPI